VPIALFYLANSIEPKVLQPINRGFCIPKWSKNPQSESKIHPRQAASKLRKRIGLGSFIALLVIPAPIFSQELTIMGGLTNFIFDKETVTTSPEINDGLLYIVGNVKLSGDFAENISYSLDLGGDSIWRYYLAGEAVFRFGLFKIGIGSFFHYSELGKEFLNPALIANFGIEIPGAFFVDGKVIMPFYENLAKTGNFSYNYLGLSVGYWTQNLVAGIYADYKEFEEQRVSTLRVRDALTRIFFHAGIYDKNRMWTVNLDMGYEVLECEMTKTVSDLVRVPVVFAGLELIVRVSDRLSWHLKGEIPYPFSYPADYFWWTATTGFTVKLAD
jgi:hypothetical protein